MCTELANMLTELVKLIPSILWFFLIVILLVLFYRPIRDVLLPNLSAFKAMGVELSFVKDSIDAALELAEKSPQWKVEVSSTDKTRALKRAKRHLKIFRDAQFLWVDDHPENNLNERRMFRQLKAEIDTAKSTEEALGILKNDCYDLIISDMARGNEATAGLKFLEQFRKVNETTPVIFYVGVFDPEKGVPVQAFGITNRPDELLHLTLDALERKKC
ncbi:MAG: response regulator [Planctomycetota bacterium]